MAPKAVIKGCSLTCAVTLHVIIAMIFEVAKMTTFPLSVNKINFDYLIHEAQDIDKAFTNIKLQTLKSGSHFVCVSHNF